MKKVKKILRISLIILLGLLLLTIIFTQTRIFKNLLRNIIVDKTNEILVNADFQIERIEGTFFSTIKIKGISLKSESETLMSLDEISLEYKLFPLITKKIIIEKVLVKEPFINLRQNTNLEWNLATIIKSKPEEKPIPKKEETKPFAWKISLLDFSLLEGNIHIQLAEENDFIPEQIEDLSVQFSADYSTQEAKFQLNKFQFDTKNPDFTLANLHFLAEMKHNIAKLTGFEIQTAQNTITANAAFDLQKKQPISFNLKAAPLKTQEFAVFLSDLPIKKLPEIFIELKSQMPEVDLILKIEESGQSILAGINADSIFTNLQYKGNVELKKLNINDWLENEKLDSDINLELDFHGEGMEPERLNATVDLLIHPTRFMDKTLDSMTMHLEKTSDIIDFQTEINGNFGNVSMVGHSKNTFTEPDYQLTAEIKELNTAYILANDSLQSNFNITLLANGKGIHPKTMQADLQILAAPSTFQSIQVDSLSTHIVYDSESYKINNFVLENTLLDFKMNGFGELNGLNELDYRLTINELEPLRAWLDFKEINAVGGIEGSVKGRLDSLLATANIQINDIKYDEVELQQFAGKIIFNKTQDDFHADVDLELDDISFQDFAVNQVQIQANGNQNNVESRIFAQADSLTLLLRNWVALDSLITIGFNEIDIQYGNLNLRTEHENGAVILDKNRYFINDFSLKSKDSFLMIDGIVAPQAEQDIHITMQNWNISLLNDFVDLPVKLAGNLTFKTDLQGAFTNPTLQSTLHIDTIKFDENLFESINLTANFQNQKLDADFTIIRNENEEITGFAKLPVNLSDSTNVIPTNEQLEVKLTVKELDLAFLSEFSDQIDRINGILDIEFALQNTIEQPELTGNIKLSEGSLSVPEFGLLYPEMRLQLTTKNRSILLNEFYLKGGDGFLKMQGSAKINKNVKDGIREFDFGILADNFQLAGKRELEVFTEMDLNLKGSLSKPVYSGTLTIPRARIDLDALQGNQSAKVDVNEPLLAQAMQKYETQITEPENEKKPPPSFVENLTGKMRILIPRNTWIKNKDLNVEIGGDIEIIKTGKDFELFGFVKTIRGNYTLYGRKFDLRDGVVTFQGGKEINPLLDITIKHIFRDINKQKRELAIALSGEASQPAIKFYLDSEELSEADAISYLLFGRSSDQISQGERSEVAGQSEASLAKSLIAKQIGGQIASEIGKKLKLDVIEFSGGDNWKQASILVGKYITNDLFLSYQKEFSLGQSKELVADKVSLEYEINKFLSLQATRGDEKSTGIDLFWKYQKK